jgi:hypothetical protein
LQPKLGKSASSISRRRKLLKTASSRLLLLHQPRTLPPPPGLPANPGTPEGLIPPSVALIALDIPLEIEAAAEAALVDDTRHVTILIVVAIAHGMLQSDLGTVTWRTAVATATSVISVTSVAIDPHGAAVAGQLAEEDGTEIVIASASVKEIAALTEAEFKTVIESILDLVNEITTVTDLIVAVIEVEIGIVVVVMIIVLDELDTLGLPPVDAHARGLTPDIAVESATAHVRALLLPDGARVPNRTRDEDHGLAADHPHDGPLPALWTSTDMCL